MSTETSKSKATNLVGDLFKLLPGTAGIMLTLIWGLVEFSKPSADVHTALKVASISLAVTIFTSLLGLQFMVSRLHDGADDASNAPEVATCFFVAWITFIAGSAAVIYSVFLI